MANVLVNDASLQDIADAIREKNGTEETYKPAEMGAAVRAIESGGSSNEIITVTSSITNLQQAIDMLMSFIRDNENICTFIVKGTEAYDRKMINLTIDKNKNSFSNLSYGISFTRFIYQNYEFRVQAGATGSPASNFDLILKVGEEVEKVRVS